jgi:hypothetical protein
MPRMFWTQKQDIGPSGREVHRMTYDSNRQRVVLFGGRALQIMGLADILRRNSAPS